MLIFLQVLVHASYIHRPACYVLAVALASLLYSDRSAVNVLAGHNRWIQRLAESLIRRGWYEPAATTQAA